MENILSYALFERKDMERANRVKVVMAELFHILPNTLKDIWKRVKNGETFGVEFDKGYTSRGKWIDEYIKSDFMMMGFTADISELLGYPDASFIIAPFYHDSTVDALAAFNYNKETKKVLIKLYDEEYYKSIESAFALIDSHITRQHKEDNGLHQKIPFSSYDPYESSLRYTQQAIDTVINWKLTKFKESIFHELIHYYDFLETTHGFHSSTSNLSINVKRIVDAEKKRLEKEGTKDAEWTAMMNAKPQQSAMYYASNHEYNAYYMHGLYSALSVVQSESDLKSFVSLFKMFVDFKRFAKPEQQRMLKRITAVWYQEVEPMLKDAMN